MSPGLVFFGTPDFAVPSLLALLGEGFDVAAVVTRPDKPQGRSRSNLIAPPVKTAALEAGLTVFQPDKPSDPEFMRAFRALAPNMGVVVAYGHILKPDLLAIPSFGVINVHASLLPKYRGAAPIQHALIDGAAETGISIMQLDVGMDTGPVLHQLAVPIPPEETGGELTARLAELGAEALVEAMQLLTSGSLTPKPQDNALATYAPKLTRELARIHWPAPAERTARMVRALDPKPGAWTTLEGGDVKLFGARVGTGSGEPGVVITTSPLTVGAGDGVVQIEEVQPSGKDRMPTEQWARGRGVEVGQRFE
ncbi:MAG: methionyl-tRNA formyltransferase [Gemmatimonadetes bacterium]|nr:methionyl-tRNA formyltransferase [Gemmatimonadota bacterium]